MLESKHVQCIVPTPQLPLPGCYFATRLKQWRKQRVLEATRASMITILSSPDQVNQVMLHTWMHLQSPPLKAHTRLISMHDSKGQDGQEGGSWRNGGHVLLGLGLRTRKTSLARLEAAVIAEQVAAGYAAHCENAQWIFNFRRSALQKARSREEASLSAAEDHTGNHQSVDKCEGWCNLMYI